ncbi:MAG: hypothetical protein G8237_12460 [Magnetococcales bacterium]|nr:hypothetical protein [Magnetococcales bacterium]NGZ07155.1 hypothetical protein [Magnetococcales bacterium]
MLSTYEALYEQGRLTWLHETPEPYQGRVIVTLMEDAAVTHAPLSVQISSLQEEELERFMQEMCGAWGQNGYEETRARIAQRRVADWGDDEEHA